jgi:hypothetical protein
MEFKGTIECVDTGERREIVLAGLGSLEQAKEAYRRCIPEGWVSVDEDVEEVKEV